jgi:succinyl-CoA synthetase beta subunit
VSDLLTVDGALPEHESALVLERYGVPVAERRRAVTPEDAAGAAAELGFPVVVKVDGVAHKAREGGVVLGISSADEAAAAAARLDGPVLVARQVEAGTEVLCGMSRDPDYGPVLVVGEGGVAVEELDHLVAVVAPVDAETAAELVTAAGIDDPHGTIADTLVALGRLARAHPQIASIDVNPLVVGPTGTIAVDALVVVS